MVKSQCRTKCKDHHAPDIAKDTPIRAPTSLILLASDAARRLSIRTAATPREKQVRTYHGRSESDTCARNESKCNGEYHETSGSIRRDEAIDQGAHTECEEDREVEDSTLRCKECG